MYGLFLLGVSLLILQLSDSQFIVSASPVDGCFTQSLRVFGDQRRCRDAPNRDLLSKKTDYNAFVYMCAGVFGIGVGFGSMGILTHYDLSLSMLWVPALGLLAGASAGFVFIPFQAATQEKTPVHMTGRVFGVVNSNTTTATIIGPLAGGSSCHDHWDYPILHRYQAHY